VYQKKRDLGEERGEKTNGRAFGGQKSNEIGTTPCWQHRKVPGREAEDSRGGQGEKRNGRELAVNRQTINCSRPLRGDGEGVSSEEERNPSESLGKLVKPSPATKKTKKGEQTRYKKGLSAVS